MSRIDGEFKNEVYKLVAQIPKGKVMSYGQIASLCGAAWAAWEVGQIAHSGPSYLPWQRVVDKDGGLAKGYPGGLEGHKNALLADNVSVDEDYRIEIKELLWWPEAKGQNSLSL